MEEAVIVCGARSPVGKAGRGSLRQSRPDDLGAHCVQQTLARCAAISGDDIDDVVIGCATPEQEQGYNIARIIAQRAGLPDSVPGMTVNRFCSSGLQSIAQSAERIMLGNAQAIIAGGAESMSFVGFGTANELMPNYRLAAQHPHSYLSMGLTAEKVAEQFNISRSDADQFAYDSHQKAIAAISNGHFADEIAAIDVEIQQQHNDGSFQHQTLHVDTDEGPRADTSLEKLATLRPVFKVGGCVTAGNSSQTSDGAATLLIMSRSMATARGLTPLAIYKGFDVAGVAPEIMGIGPVAAVPKLLKRCGLSIADIDLIELNEAFAAQSLAVIRELTLPVDKTNVNGGAIALGHPLGCTGAKLTLSLIHELRRRGGGLGLVTMCIGGGMGAAGLFEVLPA